MMPDESVDEIEKYAFDSDGKYRKLSNDIQIQIEQTIQSMLKDKEIEGLIRLYYSKALHAGYMLSEIEPEIVRKYCRNYFCDNYMELVNYY